MNKKECNSTTAAFASVGKQTYVPPHFEAIPVDKYSLICTSVNVHKEGNKSKEEEWEEDEEKEGDGLDF